MGRPCRHLRLRAIHARSLVTFHHVMNYWCLTILFGILLSTAHGNRPPDNDDVDNVTQNGITDTNVDIEYDTQTNLFYASTTRPTLQNNDITPESKNTASDITSPATSFEPTTPIPVDACDTEYVTVTSTPVHIIALTKSKCSIHVLAPNNSAIAVRLIQSNVNNISTYFYIENVGNLPQNCSDRYMVVSVDHTPCTIIISGSQFRFHFQTSDMLVELHTMDIQISTCFVTQSTAMEDARCKLKLHTRQIKQNIVRYWDEYWYAVYRTFRTYVLTRYSADCTCDCPCLCTLGYREWLSTCTDGKDINTTKVDLIVYNPNMKRLSFADTGLNAIQENAFLGFYELEVLILEGNSLSIVTPTICDNLPQLQVLDVSDNILTNLTSDVFKGQCEKQLLVIDLRKNKLTYYAHDVFSLTVNLKYLNLNENKLVHIRNTTLLEEPSLGKNQTSNLTSGVFDSLGNLIRLDLSDNNIAALPAGVFESLGNLTYLDLSDNNISALPAGVFDSLGNLIRLDLSDNNISALPAVVFDTLGNLIRLDLSDNNISALPAGVFDSLGNLIRLDLSDNNISALPAGVFDSLGNLIRLHLSDNNISALPAGVFDSLGNLTYLDLSDNNISALPAGVFDSLGNLTYLDLSDNNIAALPAGVFDSLGNLTYLDLSDNNISALPAGVFDSLGNLTYLDLSDNNISALPAGVFDSLGNLIRLYLSDNNIAALPAGVFDSLGNLRYLYLSDNNIAALPAGVFDSLGNLRYLYLSDNNIAALPAGVFDSLGNLTYLDLSDNNISALPAGVFDSLGNLIRLDLSDNNIAALPAGVFDSLGNLRYLYLSDNNIAALPAGVFDSLGNLIRLDLSDNNIAALPAGVFDSLGNLRYLYLSDNNIAALPAGVFDSLGNLIRLYLSDNNIAALPAGVFDRLGNLIRLDLSDNNISALPAGVFDRLGNLIRLDLSDNNIAALPVGVFESLVNLRVLKLHDNKIASLHEDVFNSLSMLQILLINHNYILHNLLGDVFKSMVRLRTLDLSYNAIGALPSELFTALQDLQILDLSNNGLHGLPADCFLTLENLISLSLCCNNLTINAPQLFESLTALQVLDLSRNSIIQLPTQIFESTKNLVSLDISDNYLKYIPVQCLANLSRLIYLNISKNSLSRLPSFSAQGELLVLDLSENSMNSLKPVDLVSVRKIKFLSLSKNNLVALPGELFYYMNDLIFVNISYNAVQKIGPKIFGNESKLETFDMRKNEMYRILHDSFEANPQNATIIVDKFATCCFMDEAQCVSIHPRPDYLTCKRMLQDMFLRISVWVLGLSAFICNAIAHYVRTQKRQGNKVQTLLISHLALSDLLMGVNMLILASADAYYGEYFPSYAHVWRQGFACKLAGFLSIFSSEGSVFFIALISIDRLLGIKYPFGGPLSTKWARFCVGLAWLMAFLISVIPIALATDMGDVFSKSEVCIGIPIVQRHITTLRNASVEINTISFTNETKNDYEYFSNVDVLVYTLQDINIKQEHQQQNITYTVAEITGNQISSIFSIVVFVGVNLACFFIVVFCYMYIFFKANKTSEGAGRTLDRDEQVHMAKKMFAIVFTDFCCWVPLSFICILVQCGVITVSPEMYAWTVGFILPINSSINPFLYVLSETISEHRKKKQEERKNRENIEMQVRWRPLVRLGLKFDQQE